MPCLAAETELFARALVTDFGAQWLHLRNVRAAAPFVNAFPEFDDNLREADGPQRIIDGHLFWISIGDCIQGRILSVGDYKIHTLH